MSCDQAQTVSKPETELISRLRSVPYRQPFVRSVFLSTLHYMGILATATTLAIFMVKPSRLAMITFISLLCFTAVTWLIAYFKRCSTFCPLCRGTPLMSSGALPHKKAIRFFPFNHGVSAVISIIATQKFRCMYCGTGFDILKDPSHLREEGGTAYGDTHETTYTPEEPS